MDNGITFTTNSDQMYIGHKVETGTDQTAAVIQWGDNNAPTAGPDVLKFLFAAGYSSGNFGIGGLNGLELGRFHPQGFFGLGDFQSVSLQPTERLDLLTGRVKVRELPLNPPANTMTKVLVVDDSNPFSPEYGVIKWRDVSTIGGGGNACASGWTLNGNNAVTAYDGNPCPPQAIDRVGIGATFPLYGKLHVEHTNTSGTGHVGVYTKVVGGSTATAFQSSTSGASSNRGVYAQVTGGDNNIGVIGGVSGGTTNNMAGQFHASGGLYGVGVEAISTGSSSLSRGVKASAANGSYTYGVDGFGQVNSGSVTDVIGVRGIAQSYNNATRTIGVYGDNSGTTVANSWAFWSDGSTFSMGGANWIPSDEHLKTDVQDLTDATALLGQLSPKTYRYDGDTYPFLAFRQGRQYGIMAQELEQVLPDAVRSVTRPAELDEDGHVIVAEATFKAVNHEALIPLLIASNKEQQLRISRLEEMVAACCSDPDGSRSQQHTISSEPALDDRSDDRKLRIVPNPFNESTTVYYALERDGRIQLMANSADGRDLRMLQEADLIAGDYQFQWNTAPLTPGMYYVTLLLDGQPILKKAVKVDR